MIILGLDPGLGTSGWGVIRAEGNRLSHVANGRMKTDSAAPLARRLAHLDTMLAALIADHAPAAAAVEEVFVNANPYVDLYQTHWPDHGTAYDETMETLDELIRAGKVRIIGCSNETTWGLMKSLEASSRLGVARYETIQNNHSLNNRRFEDELGAACRHEGVSSIPYSPLAGGVLSGKYNGGARPDGARFSAYLQMGGRQEAMARRFVNDRTIASTERFQAIAAEAGLSVVTLATAWSKQHDFVASTIVGATREAQLDDIFAASDVTLEPAVLKAIDAVTTEILYPMG